MLETLRDDLERHGGKLRNTAFWAVAAYRFGVWSNERCAPARWATSKVYSVLQLGVTVSSGISIPRETQIGAEIHIVHAGNINIHPSAVLGDRVTLMHDVTIGAGMTDEEGYPVIGDDVFIGAGAKILGGVTIGNGAMIAANSLVISDIPPGVTAIGVPARALPHSKGAPQRTIGDGAGKIPNR